MKRLIFDKMIKKEGYVYIFFIKGDKVTVVNRVNGRQFKVSLKEVR